MKSLPALVLAFCFSLISISPMAAQTGTGIAAGLWTGTLAIRQETEGRNDPGSDTRKTGSGNTAGQGTSLQASISLRLLDLGLGALLDIPEQSMFGYPLDQVSWTGTRLSFSFGALGPGEDLVFEGIYSASLKAVIGTARSKSWKGSFRLMPAPEENYPGETRIWVETDRDRLPGTLLIPEVSSAFPAIVILLSGSGTSDRNGNNFSVPGRSDSLALLAKALASRSIASFRYDKRGSGEAYSMAESGMNVSLDEHIEDAIRIVGDFIRSGLYSRIIVAGMNEGAWIGAAALNRLEEEGLFADGLAALAVSGERPLDLLQTSLEALSPALREEARSITEAILSDRLFPEPSAQLADFFAPQRIRWLKSWLAFDPVREFAGVESVLLFIYGQKDLQVSRPAFEKLLDARPHAAARIIPSMNYALKQVDSETENFDSFTNPEYPVPDALADLLAAFARARPAPVGSLPYIRE